mgnify:FL=1
MAEEETEYGIKLHKINFSFSLSFFFWGGTRDSRHKRKEWRYPPQMRYASFSQAGVPKNLPGGIRGRGWGTSASQYMFGAENEQYLWWVARKVGSHSRCKLVIVGGKLSRSRRQSSSCSRWPAFFGGLFGGVVWSTIHVA